ncbi:MAG: RHS repeat-associated core domain-containing protein [Parachlamydia sp.]
MTRTDPETDLIYFGRRYYDTQIARWITADPLGYEAGPNLYAYVNNSPLTSIDLYGLHIGGSVDFLEQKRDQEFKDRVSRNVSAFEKGVGNFLNHPIETIDRQEMYCSQIYESFKSGNYSEILKQWDQLNDQQKENFIYERIGEAAIESGIAIGGLILTKSKGLGILQWAVKNRAVIRDFIDDLYQKTNSRSLNSKITEQ